MAEQIKALVSRAVQEAGGRSENAASDPCDSLWEHFHRRGLTQETPDGQPVRLVLVLDQFEELFALGYSSDATRSRATAFLRELADLVENRPPESLERRLEEEPGLIRQFALGDRGYRALICLREDYLPHLESLQPQMPSLAENRMRLTRMNGLRALEAVVNPGGHLIAPDVARLVVRFVAGAPLRQAGAAEGQDLADLEIEPSLLSLVCRELNNSRTAQKLPQISHDLVAGSRERILQDFYERCIADQAPAVRAFVEDELVTDSGLRENIALERARKVLTLRGADPAALDELVRRRLLHVEERLDIQRVELTHDVLTAVVKRSRDARQQQEATQRAEAAAREVQEKARQQRRRLRWIVAGMAAALIVVGTFAVVSFYLYRISEERRREAEEQKARAERGEEEASLAHAAAVREKERAEEGEHLADRRFVEKRQAMDDMLAQFSDQKLSGLPGTQQIRKVLFQRGIEQYEAMFKDNRDDPAIALKLADLYHNQGVLQSEIESLERALVPLRKGEAVLRRLVESNPDNSDYRYHLALLLSDIGQCCWKHDNYELAAPAVREAQGIVAKLLEAEPKRFEYRCILGRAHVRLASFLSGAKQDAEHRRADDILRPLVAEYPKEPRALDPLARNTINRGFLAVDTRRYADAEALFQEARELAQVLLSINPSDREAYDLLQAALQGQAEVYGKTDRVAKGLEILTRAVEDLTQLAAANPDVFLHQQALVWAHDDLRKLYQRAGDYEKAVASLQEIIRISEGLAQRNPQNERHPSDAVDAARAIAAIYRSTKREAEAAAILDKALKQADQMMRLHPTSNRVLGSLLEAYFWRGDLSQDAQQYEQAIVAYQTAVDLYTRYRPSVAGLTERTNTIYLRCCQGLLKIAKEQQQTQRALEVGATLIALLKPGNFQEADNKQELLTALVTLSELYEDTGNVKEAIRLRVLAVEESRKILGGDPKSNWYLYQNVFESHRHLARLYRIAGDEKREFEAIRGFFREEEPYVRERDHSALLEQTASFTPENLKRLREEFQHFSTEGSTKRFTFQTDFEGVKYGFNIYVADSWEYLEDQITWVERVRGGKFPKESREGLRRLYQFAKENKVSFAELCVYALATAKVDPTKAGSESPIVLESTATDVNAILRELAEARKNLQSGKADPQARKRLAFRYARLAAEDVAGANFFRARNWLGDSRNYLDLDSLGRPRDPADADVFAYMKFVEGALLSATGELQKGYAQLAEGLQTGSVVVPAEFAVPPGAGEFALGWTCQKLKRPVEAAAWYRKALELKHNGAAGRLFLLAQESPECVYTLPNDLRQLMGRATAEATEKESAVAVFIRLTAPSREDPAIVARRNQDQITALRKLAAQCHDQVVKHEAAGQPDKAREALEREYGWLFEVYKLEPSGREETKVMTELSAIALKVATLYSSAMNTESEVKWTQAAADLPNPDALFRLADWYEKGTKVTPDAVKAGQYRLKGYHVRAAFALKDGRYEAALPDLQKAVELTGATAEDFNWLGMCYGKLNRWPEAIAAYLRAIDLDATGEGGVGRVCNLMEALVVAEQPEELIKLVKNLESKGWKVPEKIPNADGYSALYYGFQALALHTVGKDATEAEKEMRRFTGKPDFTGVSGWTWDELDGWLKATKIPADRKAAAQKIVAELKGPQKPGGQTDPKR